MSLLREFLAQSYSFINSIRVPGFNVSFLSIWLGAFGAVFSLAILKMIFGLGNSSISVVGGYFRGGLHGGNNKKIKVSEKRRKDTK